MTKHNKAAILEAIRNGHLQPSDLQPPQNYLIQYREGEGYTMDGRQITEGEYRELAKKHEADSNRRKLVGLPVGYFITVQYTPAPFAVGTPLTLDLDK
jgi:hypothetical protein